MPWTMKQESPAFRYGECQKEDIEALDMAILSLEIDEMCKKSIERLEPDNCGNYVMPCGDMGRYDPYTDKFIKGE